MRYYMLRAPRLTWTRFGWLLTLIVAINCGCSGINASKAISPLDFLLPGLLQNDPPRPVVPASTNALVCWDGGVPSTVNR
jgi:hypothetical protein